MKYIYDDPEKYEKNWNNQTYSIKHWYPIISDSINHYCKDKVVLDLGCGTGIYTKVAEKVSDKVIGLDDSIEMLAYSRLGNIIRGNAEMLPLSDYSVDIVLVIGLFEYVNREKTLREIYRILNFKGKCIIVCANKFSAVRTPARVYCHLFNRKYHGIEYSRRGMFKLFKAHNLKVLEFRMDDGLIWPPIPICGLVERFWKIFGSNPFSNIMMFVVEKN
jgi:ubiquinone/menaquinone biosynthesis C-methylase UbiE